MSWRLIERNAVNRSWLRSQLSSWASSVRQAVGRTIGTPRRIERWTYGAVNLARPDGSLSQGVGYGPNAFFVPELYMLAMTYLYQGDTELGLELARSCVYSLNIHNLLTWNQPNLLRADTGDMLSGSHYVQNLMLWAIPAAYNLFHAFLLLNLKPQRRHGKTEVFWAHLIRAELYTSIRLASTDSSP